MAESVGLVDEPETKSPSSDPSGDGQTGLTSRDDNRGSDVSAIGLIPRVNRRLCPGSRVSGDQMKVLVGLKTIECQAFSRPALNRPSMDDHRDASLGQSPAGVENLNRCRELARQDKVVIVDNPHDVGQPA